MLIYQTVIYTGAAIVFSGSIIQIQVRRRRVGPLERVSKSQETSYRTPVEVKIKLTPTHWSTKTMATMELVVGSSTFQAKLKNSLIGGIIGSEFYFNAPDTIIPVSNEPSTFNNGRAWIVIRGKQAEKDIELALWRAEGGLAIWNSLVGAGAITEGVGYSH